MKEESILAQSLQCVLTSLDSGHSPASEGKLAHNLLLTIQRRQDSMDWLLARRCRGHLKQRTRKVLYWALAELLWMNGVPAPAVVDAAVAYVKKHYSPNEASFVNGLLRNLLRDLDGKQIADLFQDAPLHVRYDLPEILCRKWIRQFGEQETLRLAQCLQKPALPVLRRKTWPVSAEPLPDFLQPLPPPTWAEWAELYIPGPKLKALDDIMGEGTQFYIQDSATLLAPTLLSPQPGETVADLCCAPGGKARILAEFLKGQGRILCADRAEDKLPRVKANLTGIPNADFACLDAARASFQKEIFDAVMLDVPCSNSGVIRRRPDVRRGFSESKLAELVALQTAILENVAPTVKPNGRLVYSTCSIEPEENELQIQTFLKKHPDFHLVCSRTLLPDEEHDGAFAALMKR